MEKVALVIVQLFMIGLFSLFGYLIVKKEYYSLISGFNSKSDEEKKILIENGYPQAIGRVMLRTSIILFIGLIFFLFGVPYAFEISLGVMFVYLLGSMIYYSKLDTTAHHKRNKLIMLGSVLLTVVIVAGSFILGFIDNEVTVTEDEVRISGMYGVEWKLADLIKVELVENLPEVKLRTNGFSFANRLKGKFRLEELGVGRLFLYKNHPPFLYIKKEDEYLFINAKDPELTKKWYHQILEKR